ncbi:diadenylate cyclase CdaA [bacterium]|nr:diadenylate cyclase CdaA [bacterium]
MQELISAFHNFRWIDLADIVMVALFFYGIFALLRGSRSYVALMGFIAFMTGTMLLYLLVRTWKMEAMILIFQNSWIVVMLIFLIVFQHDFRRALINLGQFRLFRSLFSGRERTAIDEVCSAVNIMSNRNVGALIVFERRNPLDPYLGSGTELDAAISPELIRTIFTPYSALHDGAAIIRGDRLVAAGCILPLSDEQLLSSDLGTRHRAALGMSEETDAVVVIVSEETGTVSVAVDGKIERGLKIEDLRRRLQKELNIPVEEKTAAEDVHVG